MSGFSGSFRNFPNLGNVVKVDFGVPFGKPRINARVLRLFLLKGRGLLVLDRAFTHGFDRQ